MNHCNPIEQQAVQDRLEALYEADGRHDPDHPMHCLYSGLAQAASTDEPAVPDEGREPAAVTGQPNWRGLCEELLQALEGEGYANWPEGPDGNPLIKNARAALARWGHQPAPPADGEVAELVEWLQEEADDYECIGCEDSAAKCKRAAELLQRPMADLSPTAYELLTLAAELDS